MARGSPVTCMRLSSLPTARRQSVGWLSPSYSPICQPTLPKGRPVGVTCQLLPLCGTNPHLTPEPRRRTRRERHENDRHVTQDTPPPHPASGPGGPRRRAAARRASSVSTSSEPSSPTPAATPSPAAQVMRRGRAARRARATRSVRRRRAPPATRRGPGSDSSGAPHAAWRRRSPRPAARSPCPAALPGTPRPGTRSGHAQHGPAVLGRPSTRIPATLRPPTQTSLGHLIVSSLGGLAARRPRRRRPAAAARADSRRTSEVSSGARAAPPTPGPGGRAPRSARRR